MLSEGPYLFFEVYRWAGTSFDDFRRHLTKAHGPIARRFPGLVWYESFLNKNAEEGWPVTAAPAPDAFVIMKFESDEAKDNVSKSDAWNEAQLDNPGFLSHFNVFEVDRITWIPDQETRLPFSPDPA